MKKYKAFGLTINSELAMDELPFSNQNEDIRINYNKINEHIDSEPKVFGYCDIEPNKVLLIIPDVAKFLITNGNSIIIDTYDDVDEVTLKLFVLGSCMGAVLIQRGMIPIHGSALYYKNRGILVVGDSGAGKSTLACALINRGAKLVSDDVISVIKVDNQYFAVPSVPLQKLSRESMTKDDLSEFVHREVPYTDQNRKKYYVIRDNVFYDNVIPIDNIFNIVQSDSEEVNIRDVSGSRKLKVLLNNIYRYEFVDGLKMHAKCFEMCSGISSQSNVHVIERPRQGITVQQQIENIEQVMNLI